MGNIQSKNSHSSAMRQAFFGANLVDQFRSEMYCSLLESRELHDKWKLLVDRLYATWKGKDPAGYKVVFLDISSFWLEHFEARLGPFKLTRDHGNPSSITKAILKAAFHLIVSPVVCVCKALFCHGGCPKSLKFGRWFGPFWGHVLATALHVGTYYGVREVFCWLIDEGFVSFEVADCPGWEHREYLHWFLVAHISFFGLYRAYQGIKQCGLPSLVPCGEYCKKHCCKTDKENCECNE